MRRQAENAPELNTLDSILKSVEQCSTDLDLTKVMSLVITFKFYTNNEWHTVFNLFQSWAFSATVHRHSRGNKARVLKYERSSEFAPHLKSIWHKKSCVVGIPSNFCHFSPLFAAFHPSSPFFRNISPLFLTFWHFSWFTTLTFRYFLRHLSYLYSEKMMWRESEGQKRGCGR